MWGSVNVYVLFFMVIPIICVLMLGIDVIHDLLHVVQVRTRVRKCEGGVKCGSCGWGFPVQVIPLSSSLTKHKVTYITKKGDTYNPHVCI